MEPSVEKVELQPTTKYIILGSDGLWDGVKMERVGELCCKHDDAQELAQILLKEGLDGLNSLQLDDNISVIVIPVKGGLLVE